MNIWTDFLEIQSERLGKEAIAKWVKPLKVIHFDAANLYLEAQDTFQIHWFEEHLRPIIQKTFRNNNNRLIRVHLNLPSFYVRPKKKISDSLLTFTGDKILSNCTFQSYFPGKRNEMHFKLLQSSLEMVSFNPLYIHGDPGCGKSHLLMACAHFIKNKKIFYIKAHSFTQHLVSAIQMSSMQKFRDLYREYDVLIIDDIQDISGRNATQEELFHTFNALHIEGKQIILASSLSPMSLQGIEPRLTSRFEWGLILRFYALNEEERVAFIEYQLQEKQLSLSREIVHFLTTTFPSISVLISALKVLDKERNLISLSQIKDYLKFLVISQQKLQLTPEKIIRIVTERLDVTVDEILSRNQTQKCTYARQIAMYLCRTILKMSLTKIGKLFNRDHSTVMTSIKIIEEKSQDLKSPMYSFLEETRSRLKL